MKEDKREMQGEPLDDQDLEEATGGGNYGYYGHSASQKKRCSRCGAYYFEGMQCSCRLQQKPGLGSSPDWTGESPSITDSMRDQISRPFPESMP